MTRWEELRNALAAWQDRQDNERFAAGSLAAQIGMAFAHCKKRARERGVRFGRPPKLTAYQRHEALQRVADGETQADVARAYNVEPAAISRLVRSEPTPTR